MEAVVRLLEVRFSELPSLGCLCWTAFARRASFKLSVCDCAIVGGGAIGLSIAYELAARGRSVTLIDRIEPGKETSWAGAGILPPAPAHRVLDPLDQLRQLAMSLHPEWAARLLQETGIETGFRRCGGMYVALTPGEKAALIGLHNLCIEQGIASHLLSPHQAFAKEPALAPSLVTAGLELPGECQIRNPRHLRALVEACKRRGVLVYSNLEVTAIEAAGNGTWRIGAGTEAWIAKTACVAAGAWSQRLLATLGVEFSVFPMRGQIVLYRCDRPPLQRILNIGPRYLVPRDDGRVLVGSTEEEVGFDKRTTEEGIADLRSLAESLIPTLRTAEVERTWSGLRPASFDSLPYMGEAPARPGLFVACGHFRSGLYLSPAVGVVMADLICGDALSIDLWPFRLSRG
jgi:glycine oxidase